jgi:hypothetical protein
MSSADDRRGGSRWAPLVVFGGIVAIGLTGTLVVLINHCQREEPYLDSIRIDWDPEHVRPIPPPKRQR